MSACLGSSLRGFMDLYSYYKRNKAGKLFS